MTEPIAAASTWRPVVEAAAYRCQCTGECGNPHRSGEGRCPRAHDAYTSKHGHRVRLIAAPADPLTSQVRAAGLPPEELRAWCPECFTHTARRVRRTQPVPDMPGLFDLPDQDAA